MILIPPQLCFAPSSNGHQRRLHSVANALPVFSIVSITADLLFIMMIRYTVEKTKAPQNMMALGINALRSVITSDLSEVVTVSSM